ncbi:hypothetical protein CSPX01_02665 [Colletotrichum filicis]|nr:hypothetical protein CSPX01_02665 [Colletotrichum filicis]
MVRKAVKGGLAGSIARNLSSSPVEIHAKAPEFNATEALVSLPQLRRDIEKGLGLRYGDTIMIHHVEADRRPNKSMSVCGLLCCSTILKDKRLIGQTISRVGGLLVNGFEFFDNIDVPIAMTTSHGMFDYIRQNNGAASSLMDFTISSFKPNLPGNEYDPITISDSEPDSDSSSDVSGPGSDNGDVQSIQLAWREEQSLGRRDPETVYKWMAIEEVIGFKFAKHQFPRGMMDSSKPSDYALLTSADLAEFRNATSWRNLAPELPSDEITSSLKNDELTEGTLLMVFARDEVKEVTLLPGISTMPSAQGDPLEVRRIQLSAPLARGTSGTWLVKGSAFAGMVVAFYPNQPMAMFITAQDLLQSIAESFPDLLLPSKDRSQDPLAQSQAHRQSRAVAFGHSAENQGSMQNTVFGGTTENVLGKDPEYTPTATNENDPPDSKQQLPVPVLGSVAKSSPNENTSRDHRNSRVTVSGSSSTIPLRTSGKGGTARLFEWASQL